MLITKIEAKEACDWLRAAGFPQYVQLFREFRCPVDIDLAKTDHDFLDKDALESLSRRLNTLNRCGEMRLELHRSKRRGQESVEEECGAISRRWTYHRETRRWRRKEGQDFLSSPDSPVPPGTSPCDIISDRREDLSFHSSASSTESEGHEGRRSTSDPPETSRCSSRCSSLEESPGGPPSPSLSGEGPPEKNPKKRGPGLLRRMEKLRLRGGTSSLRCRQGEGQARWVISSPVHQEETLGRGRHMSGPHERVPGRPPPALSTPRHSGSSDSLSESSSAVSTPSPVTRVRSHCKRGQNQSQNQAQNQDETQNHHRLLQRAPGILNQPLNNHPNQHESLVFLVPQGHKPGTFPKALTHTLPPTFIHTLPPTPTHTLPPTLTHTLPPTLTHTLPPTLTNTLPPTLTHTLPPTLTHSLPLSPTRDNPSVNWRTGSFHGCRGRRGGRAEQDHVQSPLATLQHRVSIYDNVPASSLDVAAEQEGGGEAGEGDMFAALDNVMERISGLQKLVSTWSESLSEDGDSSDSTRGSSASPRPPSSPDHIHLELREREGMEGEARSKGEDSLPQSTLQARSQLSSGLWSLTLSRLLTLQQLSLLKITALMDKHSPCSKQGWSWTLPKPPRKAKLSEVRGGRRVFGGPLLHSIQHTDAPLPPSILRAMLYLRTECLDQVGLFRKSGVKSRIQYLRDMVEADPEGVSFEGQSAFDVADMVKQYFRDLPEPIFSGRLSETFLHIYQYLPQDEQTVATQAAILLLPDENREALRTLLLFLRDVVSMVTENQMTPTNLAVCLAPSLFHLNTPRRETSTARSGHRKFSLGQPDPRDLSENLAATQGLVHMLTQADHLFQLPEFWPGQALASTSKDSLLGKEEEQEQEEEEERLHLEQSTQLLLREARDRSRGWEAAPGPEHVDLAFKKVGDGCPLRLWRGSVEVDAPHGDLLQRLLREHCLWEGNLQNAAVLQTLAKDTEVYRYLLQSRDHSLGPRPPQEYLLLRKWQSDPVSGPLYLSSVSTERPDVVAEGVRAQVLSCLYLVEPLGARRSRLTHLCRTDPRGRTKDWHQRRAGQLLACGLLAVQDSFRPEHRENKI